MSPTLYMIFIAMAFIAGSFFPTQAGVNAQLARVVGSPVLATFYSFFVGLASLGLFVFFSRTQWPSWSQLGQVSPWMWTGGVIGAFGVGTIVFLAPRLGAGTLMSWLLAGQLISSILFDHYGWLGFQQHPASLLRLVGLVMMILGVFFIQRF